MNKSFEYPLFLFIVTYVPTQTIRVSNLGRGNRFFSSPKRPDRFWGSPSLLFNGYRGSFQGIKRPGRDQSTAEVKDEWTYTSTPLCTLMA